MFSDAFRVSRILHGEGKHSALFSTVKAKSKHATLSLYARLPGTRDTEINEAANCYDYTTSVKAEMKYEPGTAVE